MSRYCTYIYITNLFLEISEVPLFIKKQKLTGKFAMNYIQNTLSSIRKLGFTKEADKMAQIDFAKYRDISLSTIEYNLLKTFIDVENKDKPCLKDLDTNKHYYVTQDVARVLYLWQVLINSENKFDIRSLVFAINVFSSYWYLH